MTVVGQGRPADGSPAILFFHGSNQTAKSARLFTGNTFDDLARRGAVVAYLDGHKRNWNDARISSNFAARRDGFDDVAFATAAIGFLARSYGIDTSRVYAVGFSAGGAMVIRLAHEIPTRLAGAAIISETQPVPENFMLTEAPPSALPVVLIHGTGDPLVPYEGGMASLWGFQPRGLGLSARQTAAYYAERNGITQGPESRQFAGAAESGKTWVERTDYRQDGHEPVTLYTVHGGGHVIPGPKRAPGFLAGPPHTWSPRRSSPTSLTFRPEVHRFATPRSLSRRTGKHILPIRGPVW
jgi:polyhydroxybutyrate depolymerase